MIFDFRTSDGRHHDENVPLRDWRQARSRARWLARRLWHVETVGIYENLPDGTVRDTRNADEYVSV